MDFRISQYDPFKQITLLKDFIKSGVASKENLAALGALIESATKEKVDIPSILSSVMEESVNPKDSASSSPPLAERIVSKFIALQKSRQQGFHCLNDYQILKICTVNENILQNAPKRTDILYSGSGAVAKLSHPCLIDFGSKKFTILLNEDGKIRAGGGFGSVRSAIEVQNCTENGSKAKHVAQKVINLDCMDLKECERECKYEMLYGYLRAWTKYNDNGINKVIYILDACDFTLLDFINRKPNVQLSIKEKLLIAQDYIKTIERMHEANTIHGDIKPDNLMIKKKKDGYFGRVIDFGASRQPDSQGNLHTLSKKGYGTICYTSPEVLKAPRARYDIEDRKAQDMYALGISLRDLFLVTHRDATTWYTLMVNVRSGDSSNESGENSDSLKKALEQLNVRELRVSNIIDELAKKGAARSLKENISFIVYRLLDPNPETRLTIQELREEIDFQLALL